MSWLILATFKGMNYIKRLYQSPLALLVVGGLLLIASQMRFGMGILAWIAPVPWLQYLRTTSGWKSRLAFVGVAWLAWTAAVMGQKALAGSIGISIAKAIETVFVGTLLNRFEAAFGDGAWQEHSQS